MLGLITVVIISFFSQFSEESNQVLDSYKTNRDIIDKNLTSLSTTEKLLALSIVAPEFSLFSKYTDIIELRALYVMYLNTGISDFSVGPFQMKPSFVEDMEKFISNHQNMEEKYSFLIPKGNNRDKRKFRLEHLSTWTGQLKYLDLFVSIVKVKTESVNFKSHKEKLKYWATVYNAGINCSHNQIIELQKKKDFPKFSNKFNYSDVSYEFFLKLYENEIYR